MFRYIVLGLLRGGEAIHGYALMKAYWERSGIKLSTGTFYRELSRLVADGLAVTATRAPGADPRQAPYRITERGAAAFDRWLAGPHESVNVAVEDELSALVLFAHMAPAGAVPQALAGLHEELWIRGKTLERARQVSARRTANGFDALQLLIARRQKHVAAEIEFLEEVRSAFEAWAASQAKTVPPRSRAERPAAQRRAPRDVR